ncbi:MAG: dockerin type I domain-containing protein [Firmicutes bacterium]|nr:dockerin type I domain-containing protein [Bacillota bacterium]
MADGTETTTDTIKVTVEEGESVTIILDGVSITSDSTPAIEVSGGGSVTIILVGENTLTAADDDTAGVTVTDGSTLEITGTGGLTADAVSGDTDSTITVTGGSYSDSAVVEEYIADNYSSHDNTGTYDCVVVSDSQQLIVTGGVGYTYDEETGTITITDGGDYTISMNEKAFEDIETATATDTIVIASDEDVTITLDDVTIESDTSSPLEVDGEGDVTIILSGDNTLTATGDGDAGLQKTSTDNTLTIVSETDDDGSETGSLTATGGSGAAGIGGGSGEDGANITIESGTVTATGGENAAGIGGGDGGDGTDIVISGGDVTASAGNTEDNGTASAVGGGDGGESSGIEVSCGTYNTDVTGSTADNYYSYDNDNGTYTVVRSASTVYNTAQTSTHSVTLDGLYAQLDKADAIDHSEAAEYKVVLEDLSADDEAKLESESAFANADLTFAADIKVVKYKSDGSVDTDFDYNEVLGTSLTQDVSVTFPVPVENPKVYHINSSNVLETLDTGKVSLSEDKYTVTFTADSFSVYGTAVDETTLSAGDYATNAYLQLEQQTSGVAGVYNLNLYGDKDGSDAPIYRFYEADLKLAFEDGYDITKIGAVTVTASDGIEITQGSDGEYIFTIEDTATSDCVSAYGINLGTVTVNGIGSYKLGIDESYTNRALCRDNTQSIVSSFTYGITPAQSTGNLYLNNIPVEGSTKLATSTLTVNVMFANDVKSADTDYTAMQVAYSNLSESGTVYLGSDSKTTGMTYSKITTDISSDWNGYTFTIDVPTNYTTSLTFSGDGYRTYNVSVVPTDNASVTVWNNALDSAVAVTKNSANSITADVTFLAGDIVADGVINLYDLSAVTSYFGADLGTAYSTFTRYDLNRDGKIDSRDIAMVLVSWNK